MRGAHCSLHHAIRAYDLVSSHHALRACEVRGFVGNEFGLFDTMTTVIENAGFMPAFSVAGWVWQELKRLTAILKK